MTRPAKHKLTEVSEAPPELALMRWSGPVTGIIWDSPSWNPWKPGYCVSTRINSLTFGTPIPVTMS